MKLLMSADSSDCHPTSSDMCTSGSGKTSVICVPFSNMQHQLQPVTVTVAVPAAASSTTTSVQTIVRSHLENALKLPMKTSVSTYYEQNCKLLQMTPPLPPPPPPPPLPTTTKSQQQQINANQQHHFHEPTSQQDYRGRFIAAAVSLELDTATSSSGGGGSGLTITCSSSAPNSFIAGSAAAPRKMPHSNVIFVNKTTCNALIANNNNNNNSVSNSSGPNAFANVVSTSCCSSVVPAAVGSDVQQKIYNGYDHHHHQQLQQQQNYYQQQPCVGGDVNSRPQTPDYIKSYPVMDTTVASSVKGEPELNIEFDGTTVLCRVCGDKASGFHYGVHSCEGCKVSSLEIFFCIGGDILFFGLNMSMPHTYALSINSRA